MWVKGAYSAFPNSVNSETSGINIRTYIATAALQGLAVRQDSSMSMKMRVEMAVEYADALIAELDKEPKT